MRDWLIDEWWYIAVPPVIEPRLQSEYVVKEGSTLRVLCEVTGRPTPQIVWRRPDSNGSHSDDPLLSDLVSLRVQCWACRQFLLVKERQTKRNRFHHYLSLSVGLGDGHLREWLYKKHSCHSHADSTVCGIAAEPNRRKRRYEIAMMTMSWPCWPWLFQTLKFRRFGCVLWLNDASQSRLYPTSKVSAEVNRKCRTRKFTNVLPSTPYTECERHNTQLQADRQTTASRREPILLHVAV